MTGFILLFIGFLLAWVLRAYYDCRLARRQFVPPQVTTLARRVEVKK